jgi:hypothetical protein
MTQTCGVISDGCAASNSPAFWKLAALQAAFSKSPYSPRSPLSVMSRAELSLSMDLNVDDDDGAWRNHRPEAACKP